MRWTAELDGAGWEGRGKVRGLRLGDAVVVRVDAVTTQTRRFKTLARDFFRTEMRGLRADYSSVFEVEIFIETAPRTPRHDVDNVAKAMLDALTGSVFRDDSQVQRLVVERSEGEAARVWVRARPLKR